MDYFLGKHVWLKLTQEDVENLNRSIIWNVITDVTLEKGTVPRSLNRQILSYPKKQITLMNHKIFWSIE